ncbi:MAG: hypothetical protein ACLPLP_00635 [Mycobacterium sp.]
MSRHWADGDVAEAEAAIDRLAGMRADGFVLCDVLMLRLHRSTGAGSRRYRDLRALSGSLPRQGQNAWLRGTYRPLAELWVLLAHSM